LHHYVSGTADVWDDPQIVSLGAPSAFHNSSQQQSGLLAPHQLAFHPGSAGQNSVIRWTAPAAGSYAITGSFSGVDSATTDVGILHGSSQLFSGNINGQGSTAPFSFFESVQAGESIDFTVGFGGNGFFSDSTGLDVQIVLSAVHHPDLTVENLVATVGTTASDPVSMSWNTANHGDATAIGGWTERILVTNATTGAVVKDTKLNVTSDVAVDGKRPGSF